MMDDIPVREQAGGDASSQAKSQKKNGATARLRSRVPALVPLNLTREQALRQLETFHALIHMFTECNNDITLMAGCVAQMTAQTIGDLGLVLLLEGRHDVYRVVAVHAEDPQALELVEQVLAQAAAGPTDHGWAATVVRSGETLFLPEAPREQFESIVLPAFQEYYRRIGISSVMIVPLTGRGGVVGAIAMTRHRQARRYTETDRQFLEQIAFMAGRAIESASLVATLRREVAARLLATRALAASEQRFLSIFHASSLGITVMDLEGTMLEANASFQELCGYAENELIAMQFHDIVQSDDAPRVMDIFKALTEGAGAQAELEHRILRGDGAMVWVKTTLAVVPRGLDDQQPSLVFGISEDLSERKQRDADLLEVQQHLQAGIEMERLKLAQNLHDRPLQELYAVIYKLEELRLSAAPDQAQTFSELIEDIRNTLNALRSTASELRPPTLSRFGLEKAIRSYMQDLQEKHPGLQVKLTLARDGQSLPEPVRLALFRVLQEAVNNALRHAQATEIEVRFSYDAEEARLEVTDNGRGFVVPANWVGLVREGHYGLAGMAERVSAAGGRLSVESAPGSATNIRVTIPLQLPA